MSLIKAQGAGEVSTGFYSHLLDQSLKFNDADSPYLRWAPASQGSLTTFTFSFWYKRCVFGTYQEVFHEYPGSGERSQILFMNDDTFKVELEAANTNHFRTNRVFRDPSAWYNIVVAFDSTNGTEASRVKIYVNGVDESDTANGGSGFSTANYPNQHATSGFNRTNDHEISTYDGSDYHLDGYLAEVNFIDGTALTAASFGETKNGIWIPKDTSGLTFGTNGFHLTFKDDVISEGFNTVTYTGTGAAHSVSGVGFDPDFVWIKSRSNSDPNELIDTVRGSTKRLRSEATNAESTASSGDGFASFDADGFTLNSDGGGGQVNGSGRTYAAWAWEAGGAPTADNSAGTSAVPTANSAKVDGSNHGSALSGSIAFTRASANTTKGFSVITYTGNGSAGATVDHLLGDTPDWFIVKRRDSSGSWQVFHTSIGATKFIDLQSNGAEETNTNRWNDTAPTSSVVSLGTNSNVNSNGATYVMYCWAGKSGYSAFGSYTGNGGSQAIDVGFTPAWVMLRRTNGGTWGIFDNTRQTSGADRNLQMLGANSNAAETTNSQMTFSGNTFNDNGYLSDSSATVLYMAFADTREAAFFKDVSGNGQHWSPVNLDYRDSVPDVPTNNFCTIVPMANIAESEGNLKVATSRTGNWDGAHGTHGVNSGKWYYEALFDVNNSDSSRMVVGWIAEPETQTVVFNGKGGSADPSETLTNQYAFASWLTEYYADGSGSPANTGTAPSASDLDIINIAADFDNNKMFFGINGTYYANDGGSDGNPAGNSNESVSGVNTGVGDYIPWFQIRSDGTTGSNVITFNFGQDSSFAGQKSTANSNADGNGHGSFAYAPPSGFLALCSQNLPDPAITDGTEHFNTVLYTAASSNGTYNITGNGFQPDWSWVKNRDDVERNLLFDSVRGNTSMTDKFLVSDATSTEGGNGVTGTTVTVNADGMQIVESSIDSGELYFNSRTYVMWNWLAATTFSNDASATSVGTIDSSGRANTTAGFSIVSYTGTGSAGTIKHGLSAAPEMLIVKNRDTARDWVVYHSALGATKRIWLNYTYAEDSGTAASATWNDTAPTSSVFSVGTNIHSNESGDDFICYAFHSVEGYSKVGSYVGNGNSDGPFIYTGFRPAWIMIKNATDAGEHWEIWDNTRDTYNVLTKRLRASSTGAEVSSTFMDFVSNGVKHRNTSGGYNASGKTFIYLAFAEQPFKFSNAR